MPDKILVRDEHGNVEEMGLDEIKDHILVRSWLNTETGREEPDHCLSQVPRAEKERGEGQLTEEGLVLGENGGVALTAKGKDRARSLIRRHRLAERLFAVVFNLSEEAVHAQACRMEHEKVLTP
ncbi:MAG: hypothetical protein HY466_01505, partial [Deltaproteobacteria bacterium]|nr:hypothetical protein [Deltaproteobacteria bacterium]